MPGGQVSRGCHQRYGFFGLHQDEREDENEGGDQDRQKSFHYYSSP
jgi:hypothetical protein